jgi:biotin synthase
MIAVTRMVLKDVNIAAATALQALDPEGRERGLRCGANIIMPNVTDTALRPRYQLYTGKPNLDENAAGAREKLVQNISGMGEQIGWDAWGDAPAYARRVGNG